MTDLLLSKSSVSTSITVDMISISKFTGNVNDQLELFALVNLGLLQSLSCGILTPSAAIERFYNGKNCLHVKNHLRTKETQEIMSRGVQLADLFDSLDAEEAQREFYYELERMRALCLTILGRTATRKSTQRAAA